MSLPPLFEDAPRNKSTWAKYICILECRAHFDPETLIQNLQVCKLVWNWRPVSATIWMAPSHNWPIRQDRSKCARSCLNLLHTSKLIPDCRAVSAIIWIAPSHDWPIRQDRSKCDPSCLNLLHTSKLIPDCRAVSTFIWIAPSHNWPIRQDRSKCAPSCLNLLHTSQLIPDCRAVSTFIWIAPSHNWPIHQDRSKCARSCLNLLHTSQLMPDVSTILSAPRDSPVTPTAKRCKSSFLWYAILCCCYLSLYGNSCQLVSIFNFCGLQRLPGLHQAMVCGH